MARPKKKRKYTKRAAYWSAPTKLTKGEVKAAEKMMGNYDKGRPTLTKGELKAVEKKVISNYARGARTKEELKYAAGLPAYSSPTLKRTTQARAGGNGSYVLLTNSHDIHGPFIDPAYGMRWGRDHLGKSGWSMKHLQVPETP